MPLTPEEVRHLATLSRVGLSEAEVERLGTQLSDILEHFQVLQDVDTEGVPPTGHSTAVESVVREDDSQPSLPQEDALANAPHRQDTFFRVRVVLEDSGSASDP